MEFNFNVFLGTLQRISYPTTPANEIARILVTFQHEVNVHFFYQFTNKDFETKSNAKHMSSSLLSLKDTDKSASNELGDTFDDENLIIAPFKSIFQIFLESYLIHSQQTKLLIAREIGVFLTRLIPYYPEQISESFIQTVRCASYNPIRAPLIISIFIFIARQLSPPLLQKFLLSSSNTLLTLRPKSSVSMPSISPLSSETLSYSSFSFGNADNLPAQHFSIFTQFNLSHNDLSEHIPSMIQKLGFFGHDWLHELLKHFLDNVPPKPGRRTIRAIAATINHFPSEFLRESIETLKQRGISDFLSIFSFVFFSHESEMKAKLHSKPINENESEEVCLLYKDEVDITCLIDAAFDLLKSESESADANMQNIDYAIQVLSICQDLSISIKNKNGQIIYDSDDILNDDQSSLTIIFNFGKKYQNVEFKGSFLLNHTTFYRLSLPLFLLKPRKSENILISTSKFHTLAWYAKMYSATNHPKTKIIAGRFNEALYGTYDEFVSSAIQALSFYFKGGQIALSQDTATDSRFFINMTINLLRHLLLCPMASWFQCIDALTFIQCLDINSIDYPFIDTIIHLLVDFSLNKNSKLSKLAAETIVKFVTPANQLEIMKIIIDRIEFFDTTSMEKLIPALIPIVKLFNGFPSDLDYFLMQLIEVVSYEATKFSVIATIFDLLAASNITYKSSMDKVVYIAYIYIVTLYEMITGMNWVTIVTVGERLTMKKLLWPEIDLRNIDIITQPTDDIKSVLLLMKSALAFVFKVDTLMDIDFSICINCFELFPYETSTYLLKNWNDFPYAKQFLSKVYKRLQYINDINVMQIWCRIVIKELLDTDNDSDDIPMDKVDVEIMDDGKTISDRVSIDNIEENIVKSKDNYVETSSSECGYGKINSYDETISFLNMTGVHYMNSLGRNEDDLKKIATFAVFAIVTYSDGAHKILHFLNSLEPECLETVLYYAKKDELKGETLCKYFNNQYENPEPKLVTKIIWPVFHNFDFELDEKVDPNIILETAIYSNSKKNVKRVLRYCKKKNLKINLPFGRIDSEISKIISKWLGKNQHNVKSTTKSTESNRNDQITFNTLLEALQYVSTDWQYAAIATIKNNHPDNIIFQLCTQEKVKKQLLINLCSIVGKIRFDKTKLFNLCNLLLYEAKTTKRQRVTMRLFTTSMAYAGSIPSQIITSFVSELGNSIPTLPFFELTLCIETIGDVTRHPIKQRDGNRTPDPFKRRLSLTANISGSNSTLSENSMPLTLEKEHKNAAIHHRKSMVNFGHDVVTDDSANLSLSEYKDVRKASSNSMIPSQQSSEISLKNQSSSQLVINKNINKCVYYIPATSDVEDLARVEATEEFFVKPTKSGKYHKPSKEFFEFAKQVRDKLTPTNPLYGNVQRFFFQYFKPENMIIYGIDEEDYLIRYLNTQVPSIFLNGLRQFAVCMKTMTKPESERFIKNVSRTIFSKIFDFIEIPFFNDLFMDDIIIPLLGCGRYDHMSNIISSTLANVTFKIPRNYAIYPKVLKWLPLAIRHGDFQNLLGFSSSLFNDVSSPLLFSIAIQCLIEKVQLVTRNKRNQQPSIESKHNVFNNADEIIDQMIMDSLLTFLEQIHKNSPYHLVQYLIKFAQVCNYSSMNPSFITMVFTQLYMKSPRFFPVYAALLEFIKLNPKNAAIPIIKESILQLSTNDYQKKAMSLLEIPQKYKEALLIAQNADCITSP